ncbi:MAG: type II secretion system protein [Myxococcales bacterium]|nr:type II secretion system protein [Myxococcales bacterium]
MNALARPGSHRFPRGTARRARARGLTLIEVLIVMVIAVVLASGFVFASGQVQRSRLKSSASRVGAAMRTAYQLASSTGRRLRLVIDMDQSAIWIEESNDRMLLANDPAGGANPATATEEAAQTEAARITLGPSAPKAGFTALPGAAGQPQSLYGGIVFRAVDAAHEPKPRTAGRAYVYFFASETERASVQLQIKDSVDDKDTFSVVLAPLTGKATIAEGPVAVLHPRDDAEASEAEDDGR